MKLKICLAIALAGTAVAPLNAAVIPGLFNTGTDANNVALVGGNGVTDPHYTIVASTSPGFVGQQAVTYRNPAYTANDANSRWVSLSATGTPANNTLTYRLTFSLANLNPLTASITGRAGTDNSGTVRLNGGATQAINGFGALVGFAFNSGFVAGANTLDFTVVDVGVVTGFRVDDLVGTAAPVPEPASWALMLAGFGFAGTALRVRARRAVTA